MIALNLADNVVNPQTVFVSKMMIMRIVGEMLILNESRSFREKFIDDDLLIYLFIHFVKS